MSRKEFYDNITGTTEEEVLFPDGTILIGDKYKLYEITDIFLSEYGFSGLKTLEEFTNMIDETDPVLVDGLLTAIEFRNKRRYGDKKTQQELDGDLPPVKDNVVSEMRYGTPMSGANVMTEFLYNMGADKKELEEAKAKLKDRKIDDLKDYSYLNNRVNGGKVLEQLPQEDFIKVLKSMKEDREKAINFNLSIDTMAKRATNG